MNAPVLFEELATRARKQIALITLNRPARLNGLSLDMCRLLLEQLRRWALDDGIALDALQALPDARTALIALDALPSELRHFTASSKETP